MEIQGELYNLNKEDLGVIRDSLTTIFCTLNKYGLYRFRKIKKYLVVFEKEINRSIGGVERGKSRKPCKFLKEYKEMWFDVPFSFFLIHILGIVLGFGGIMLINYIISLIK